MNYSLHPEAEAELAYAAAFYKQQAGLVIAKAFLTEFESVAKLLVQHPEIGALTASGMRIHPFRRFPYSVIYRATPEGPRIFMVGHQHRRPNYWRGRA